MTKQEAREKARQRREQIFFFVQDEEFKGWWIFNSELRLIFAELKSNFEKTKAEIKAKFPKSQIIKL